MRELLSIVFASSLVVNCGGGNDNHGGSTEAVGGNGGAAGSTGSVSRTGGTTGAGGASSAVNTTSRTGGTTGAGGASSAVNTTSRTGGTSSTVNTTSRTGGTSSTVNTTSRTGGTTGSGGASSAVNTTSRTGGTSSTINTTSRTGGTTGVGGATGAGGSVIGTGGSTGPLLNVLDVVVDQGPPNIGYVNGLFAKVTLCEPGTNNCQSIDHVIVDTGSFGLRVLESALTLSLPAVKNSTGNPLAECAQFVSGTAWGPIVRADVKLGGETAASIPIQVIGEKAYPMPNTSACSGTAINDIASLGSNGILGIGIYQQDCGASCTLTSGNPGIYMACTSSQSGGCKSTTVPLGSQVINPIVAFPVDNNGLIIQLPSVPDQGSALVSGKLVFGIGTQSNNGLGSAKVFTPVDDYGNIGTTFPKGGAQYTGFLDSGSNAIYFLNSAKSGLTECTSSLYSGFYCPSSTTSLSATIFGNNNSSADVNFNVANVTTLSGSMSAFNNLAGPMPGFPSTAPGSLDYIWGLNFFFGRDIYTAIEQQSTPSGQGPYVAF